MKDKQAIEDIELSEENKFPIDCYENRELSWLKFNERVLEEANDTANPLCEQMNFLSIFQSNLDEFFMVRTGTLYDERKSKLRDNKTYMTSREQLDAVLSKVRKMLKAKDKCYRTLLSQLKLNGIEIVHYENLSGKEKHQAGRYFLNHILPLLSPQVVSPKQPFPFLANKEIYTVVLLEKKPSKVKGKTKKKNCLIGIIPSSGNMIKRVVPVSPDGERYILAEELIREFVPHIFQQYHVIGSSLIRLVRNADISIDDDQQDDIDLKSKDYRKAMERMIATRKRMGAIKLEYTGKIDADLISMLCAYLKLPQKHAFYSEAPLDLSFLYTISDMLSGKRELFFEHRVPQQSPNVTDSLSMIEQIKKKDLMLSYPYESMRPFLRLLNEAAVDPDVVSIRITLYRVAKMSQVVSALVQAAENGKDVLALVELRARFDEENNVEHSRELENAGCRIIYGLDNIKVHSKLCLITRRNGDRVEYITQIGTGNYNEKTARLYTDYSLMTANRAIGEEAALVFNALALNKTVETTNTLMVAPNCLQNKITEKIDQQIELAKSGKPAYVGFKLNSLTDKVIIDKLIEASKSGVKIQMLIRGICCLVTGVPGYTDNIEVYSIVGRYLEHGRIYIFGCNGNEEVYISSADLMTRNTTRRVEVGVPIYDLDIKNELLNNFHLMLSDTSKLRIQLDDGSYVHVQSEGNVSNVQEFFAINSYERAGISPDPVVSKVDSTQNPEEPASSISEDDSTEPYKTNESETSVTLDSESVNIPEVEQNDDANAVSESQNEVDVEKKNNQNNPLDTVKEVTVSSEEKVTGNTAMPDDEKTKESAISDNTQLKEPRRHCLLDIFK